MTKFIDKVFKNQSLLYKALLYILSVVVIVMLFPRGGQFKYGFQKGKPWQHADYYAPFDFSAKKTEAEVEAERNAIKNDQDYFFSYDASVAQEVQNMYSAAFDAVFEQMDMGRRDRARVKNEGLVPLSELYEIGLLKEVPDRFGGKEVFVVKNHQAQKYEVENLPTLSTANRILSGFLTENGLSEYEEALQSVYFSILRPNLTLDEGLTQKALDEALNKVTLTTGMVDKGKLIIAKGEVVGEAEYRVLDSLKQEYVSEVWNDRNLYLIIGGYSLLVALVLLMLLLFLKNYKPDIFDNNTKVTFIFVNILLMVFLTTFMVTYNEAWIYAVPLCLLPLILKTFFDSRVAFYTHVLTVLILGFVVPDSFEYIFLQITAGIVTILSVGELYRRANLFISVGQVTGTYLLGYLAFHLIQEGQLENLDWILMATLCLNGLLTLFALPLVYAYEKLFGLVSDATLLELSDTNSKLLKQLSNKAPGTFHHSLQVANLAEAAANEVNANSLLVRVGALYHDIGKMENPTFFTENQITNVNPHDELEPHESAQIIIGHVLQGIELGKKHKLPDRIIDFIRVHHGTSLVYYFFKKAQEALGDEVNEADFRYPGPKPFSKETAILMMADAVEAASKSLKDPNFNSINDFVERIIGGQMQAGQFLNANITFKEVEQVKKVLKRKLVNIYHLRVEYPE
ncbi:HD family phosphohydrolase [Sediminicola luteus]|uniref:Phosphohydrolase n=1 Tax=Sediminicola luteus TaxID=319238 RepID=A0A2A4G256_9FLAO|nr:HDIG domain-containing metalloprotein [Sediminicola luteus]PCE62513.1 phosphohydrolase [Sediminicola luteus]